MGCNGLTRISSWQRTLDTTLRRDRARELKCSPGCHPKRLLSIRSWFRAVDESTIDEAEGGHRLFVLGCEIGGRSGEIGFSRGTFKLRESSKPALRLLFISHLKRCSMQNSSQSTVRQTRGVSCLPCL